MYNIHIKNDNTKSPLKNTYKNYTAEQNSGPFLRVVITAKQN